MSWSDPTRRALLGLSLAGLAGGCFRPMLAERAPARALDGRIALPVMSGRTGYHLTRRLEDRLGTPRSPDYRLEVDLALRTRGLAIAQDRAITRRTVTATARWRLVRPGRDAPVLAGTELAESGYNETGALYATRVTARDIERRLAEEVAERIARTIQARAGTVAAAAPA